MPKPPPPAPSQVTILGHQPEWDPPAAMTAALRWTCPAPCGATVIRYGRNVYGSATDRPCTRTDQALLLAVMRTDAAVIGDTSKEAAARQAVAYAAAVERWGQPAMERLSAWSVEQRCDAAELVLMAEQQPDVLLRVLIPRVDAAALNRAATVSRPDEKSGVVVTLGGVEVHVGVREDGRLRVWIEDGGDDAAPLLHTEERLLPVQFGIFESVVFETDERGLGSESDVFDS